MAIPASDYRPSPSQRVSDQARLYEATHGAEGGTLEGRPVLILTHTGANTGAIRKTPVMRIPDGDGYLAVASAAGLPSTRPGTTTCAGDRDIPVLRLEPDAGHST